MIKLDKDTQQIYDDILISKTLEDKYESLIKNIHAIKEDIIKQAIKSYIKDLDRIIKNSPPLTKEITVYRGVKDKYYYPDKNNKTFINNTFMSTSYSIYNAYEFAGQKCCMKKIICKPGTSAIFLECITSHPRENEILLGLNNRFNILKDESRVNIDVHQNFYDLCEFPKNKMTVTTMETN